MGHRRVSLQLDPGAPANQRKVGHPRVRWDSLRLDGRRGPVRDRDQSLSSLNSHMFSVFVLDKFIGWRFMNEFLIDL